MVRAAIAATLLAVTVPGAVPAAGRPAPALAIQPAWSPSGDAIAYTGRATGSERTDVYVALAPGGPSWDATAADSATVHGYPSWSRGGGRLALRAETDSASKVVVATRDGATLTTVGSAGGSGQTCFAADDRTVAFDGFAEVYAARADGGAQWTLRDRASFVVCSPHSPRIAFAAGAPELDVFTANPDGKRVRRLTSAPGNDIPLAWSRDGRRILFSTDRSGKTALDVMNADGSRQHRVAWAAEGDLSPDGRSVAYATPSGLYAVETNGRLARRIVLGPGFGSPRWSPTGRWIAFTVPVQSPQGDSYRIDLVRPSGLARHTIAP